MEAPQQILFLEIRVVPRHRRIHQSQLPFQNLDLITLAVIRREYQMLIIGANAANFACLHKAVDNGHGLTKDISYIHIPAGSKTRYVLLSRYPLLYQVML